MGYGEFDGGGSMKWCVVNTDTDPTTVDHKGKTTGRDKHPPKGDTTLDVIAIWVDGKKDTPIKCDGHKVVIAWGTDALSAQPPKC